MSASGTIELPKRSVDPAFDRYVDLHLLGRAIHDLDAAGMADVGLQLAEVERILLRPHRGGITSRTVLSKAAVLAAKKRDQATLKRVAHGAENIGDKELLGDLDKARKPAGASRAPTANVSLEEMTPEGFALLKSHWDEAMRAELLGHAERLKATSDSIQQTTSLPQAHREVLQRHVSGLLEQLPKEQSAEDRALAKLSGASRGISWQWAGINSGFVVTPDTPSTFDDPSDPPVTHRKISCRFENRTNYDVAFNLGTSRFRLNPRNWGQFWINTRSDLTPTVRIWRLDRRYRDFTITDGGSYAFQVNPQTRQIENYFR